MTFEELMVQVQANINIKNNEEKGVSHHNYTLAHLMAYAMNDPSKMPAREKVYPVFKEDGIQERIASNSTNKGETTPQWQIDKLNMLQYTQQIKESRKAKGVE